MGSTPDFGSWLKARRKAVDLTQDALAARVGCSFETIQKIEAGTRRPSQQIALLLAEHLAVDPAEHAAFVAFARGAGGLPPGGFSNILLAVRSFLQVFCLFRGAESVIRFQEVVNQDCKSAQF